MEYLLIITSTYGEGEMPDNAQLLWMLCALNPRLKLDISSFPYWHWATTAYDLFCKAGIDWDNRLVELGANPRS